MAEEEVIQEQEQAQEQPKKKNILDWMQDHPKATFWIRFGFWVIFACILPFVFIAWRYGIFTNASKISLSNWGIIAIIIVIIFAINLVRYVYKGMKPGLAKQCISGFCLIILPLLIILLVIESIKNNIKFFEQAIVCVTICEAIGIPFNPFPTWLEQRRVEQGKEQVETMTDVVLDKIKEKFGKNGNQEGE